MGAEHKIGYTEKGIAENRGKLPKKEKCGKAW
jgi:hypothetical protein